MKVYLAGPWSRRHEVAIAATAFEQAGCLITKRWWEVPDVPGYHTGIMTPEEHQEVVNQATEDWVGVLEADTYVCLNWEKSEGKAVEFGIALASGMRLVIVGRPFRNIFQYLPIVEAVDTVEEAVRLLKTA
jgi:hypothetical protein